MHSKRRLKDLSVLKEEKFRCFSYKKTECVKESGIFMDGYGSDNCGKS